MAPLQPWIVPPRVAKMKFAGPVVGGAVRESVTTKVPAPAPATPPVGLTMFANVAFRAPEALTIVDELLPLFTGHHGEAPLEASPHGLITFGSCRSAGISAVLLDMRL